MFGPVDNRITSADRAQAYELLGFEGNHGSYSIPASLDLATILDITPLLDLCGKAWEEHRCGSGRGTLRGLTEYRVGVELATDRSGLGLTEVKQGRPNHGGRVVDRTRTIVGTLHTHPWDVAQSIANVRNLIRANDIVGGVVTYTGRISLLIKHPDTPERDRAPFASEIELQTASLKEAPKVFMRLGLLGALSASFDLPIRSTRDPYIAAVCCRLGLLSYAGDVATSVLQRG